jgi:hypothetical protein
VCSSTSGLQTLISDLWLKFQKTPSCLLRSPRRNWIQACELDISLVKLKLCPSWVGEQWEVPRTGVQEPPAVRGSNGLSGQR